MPTPNSFAAIRERVRPLLNGLVFQGFQENSESLPKVLKFPFGTRQNTGQDQAEGLTLFGLDGGEANYVLVVYDSTAPRRRRGASAVEADLFALP